MSETAESVNVFLKYERGTVQVEDMVYNVQESEMQNENQIEHFDYTILIPTATAATDSLMLTELQKLSTLEK